MVRFNPFPRPAGPRKTPGAGPKRRSPRAVRPFVPVVEALEDRCLLNGTNPLAAPAALVPAAGLYGCDSNRNLFRYDPATNHVVVLTQTSVAFNDIAFGPDGTLYGVGNLDLQGTLYQIDLQTGQAHAILDIGNNVPALVSRADGVLYAADAPSLNVPSKLYAIDVTARTVTPVPIDMGNFTVAGDLEFDSSGALYMTAIGTTSSQLVKLDLANGVATAVGPIDFQAVFGLGWDAAAGTMYGMTSAQGGFQPVPDKIISVNLETPGQSTTVKDLNDPAITPAIHHVTGTAFWDGGVHAPPPPGVYASDDIGRLFAVNTATGTGTEVGTSPMHTPSDLAFSREGVLYGTDATHLFVIDPSHFDSHGAPAQTPLGTIRLPAGTSDPITALAFSPDDQLYAAGHNLYQIDRATLAATPVPGFAALSGNDRAGALAFADAHTLFMTVGDKIADDHLLRISLSGGTAAVGASLTMDCANVQGLAFVAPTLYGFNDPTSGSQVFAITVDAAHGTAHCGPRVNLDLVDPTTGTFPAIGIQGATYWPGPPTPGLQVSLTKADTQSDPAGTSPVRFSVVFSQPVNFSSATPSGPAFGPDDLSLSGTAGPSHVLVSPQGDGKTFTVQVSGMTGPGSVVVTLRAGTVSDANGDANAQASAGVTFGIPDLPLHGAFVPFHATATLPPGEQVVAAFVDSDPNPASASQFTAEVSTWGDPADDTTESVRVVADPGAGFNHFLVKAVKTSPYRGAGHPVVRVGVTDSLQFGESGQASTLSLEGPITVDPAADNTPPTIVDWTPRGPVTGFVDHVDVTFSEPIDPASFTSGDVLRLLGPRGTVTTFAPPFAVPGGGAPPNTVFRVPLPVQSAPGPYALVLGTQVRDLAGNAMRPPAPLTWNIVQTTTTSVYATPYQSNPGDPVRLIAVVIAPVFATGTPTGTVTFYADSNPVGQAALAGGRAQLTTGALGVGVHQIVAAYSGDPLFQASTSPQGLQIVTGLATAVTLTSSATAVAEGQPVTFTATVAPRRAGAGIPSGQVTFTVGNTVYAADVQTRAGKAIASFTTSALPPGVYTATASYSGDGRFQQSSTAGPLTLAVTDAAEPDDTSARATAVPTDGTPQPLLRRRPGLDQVQDQ